MEAIRRDTEAFQERLIDDHPPELAEGEHFDTETGQVVYRPELSAKKKDPVPDGAAQPDVYCTVHQHWVSPDKIANVNYTCSDRGY
jgi:hypothetical protein